MPLMILNKETLILMLAFTVKKKNNAFFLKQSRYKKKNMSTVETGRQLNISKNKMTLAFEECVTPNLNGFLIIFQL